MLIDLEASSTIHNFPLKILFVLPSFQQVQDKLTAIPETTRKVVPNISRKSILG